MDTHVTGKNSQGQDVNRDGEVVLNCKEGCGRKTTMDGTRLCDFCWEKQRHGWDGYRESKVATPCGTRCG